MKRLQNGECTIPSTAPQEPGNSGGKGTEPSQAASTGDGASGVQKPTDIWTEEEDSWEPTQTFQEHKSVLSGQHTMVGCDSVQASKLH